MKLEINDETGRIDVVLSNMLEESRSKIQRKIKDGKVLVNNKEISCNYQVAKGDIIEVLKEEVTSNLEKKEIPLDIVFEDENLLIINKQSGLVVHPAPGHMNDTLVNALLVDYPLTDDLLRPGIVHRLDKDTSGIVLFAKDEKTKNQLQENWNEYVSLREYTAIVSGHPKEESGQIVQYLKETKTNLVYVSRHEDGKKAITNYSVLKSSNNFSMLKVTIETGRKNQIRVAFSSKKMPIVGDKKYGDKNKVNRLFLHANRLKIYYPAIKKDILFETSIPNEFKKFMDHDA